MKIINTRNIVFLSILSLFGLICLQLFWLQNAINISEKQFEHRVTIALSKVLAELNEIENNTSTKKAITKISRKTKYVTFQTNKVVFDSLLSAQFHLHNLPKTFSYSIINSKTDSCIYCKEGFISSYFSLKSYNNNITDAGDSNKFQLAVYFPTKQRFILQSILFWLILSANFIIIVAFSFVYIVKTIIKQKKLTDIKTDFINNMTHELKTPISTISLASEVLAKKTENLSPTKIKYYTEIIYNENNKLKMMVDRVLDSVCLDKGEIILNKENIDLHETIKDVAENFFDPEIQKSVYLKLELLAEHYNLYIDRHHFEQILGQLLENSYKYSVAPLYITIGTYNKSNNIYVTVKDNGIGMTSEQRNNIFEKFYRVYSGNIHNAKGFGLGLHYVKSLVFAHSGTIHVESQIDIGSVFTIGFPIRAK